jgi:hypothetical protein
VCAKQHSMERGCMSEAARCETWIITIARCDT